MDDSRLCSISAPCRCLSYSPKADEVQRLTKSKAGVDLLQKLLLQEENHQLGRIADFLERNPLRFDPNPWDYLSIPGLEHGPAAQPNFYPDGGSAFELPPKRHLSSLPTELLLKIIDQLPAKSGASLALVDGDLYHRLGARCQSGTIRQDWRERFEFLQILERDTKGIVACPRCISLHYWISNNCEFRWWKRNCDGIPHKFPYIPRFYLRALHHLDYGFVRTIGRLSVKFGPDSLQCREALRIATPPLKSLWFETVCASMSISNRIVDGNLISRTQIAVSPYWTDGTFTGEAFRILTTALTAPQFQICDHFDFPRFLQYLDAMAGRHAADLDDDQYPEDSYPSEADRWGTDGVILQDNYTFYKSSQDDLGILGKSWRDSERKIRPQLHEQVLSPAILRLFDRTMSGQVRSCTKCATDFGLAVEYVPGVGKALVMNIWRDVGVPCKNGEDELRRASKWKWDSHRCDRYHYQLLHHHTKDKRRLIQAMAGLGTAGSTSRGAIFKSFEADARGLGRDELSATYFNSELSDEEISALQQKDARSCVGFDEFFNFDDHIARDRQTRAYGQLLEGVECAEPVGQIFQGGRSARKCLLSDKSLVICHSLAV